MRQSVYIGIALGAVVLCCALFVVPREAKAAAGDGAASNIRLFDSNANGKIDTVSIDIANPNGESWHTLGSLPNGFTVTQNGSAVGITGVSIANPTANPVTVSLTLNESQMTVSTDGVIEHPVEVQYQPTAAYSIGPNISDGVDEQLQQIASGDISASNTEIDKATPFMKSAEFYSSNTKGFIDRIRTQWSEKVTMKNATTSDWFMTGGSIGMSVSSTPDNVTPNEAITFIASTVQKGTASSTKPTLYYIQHQNKAIQDVAGNAAPTGTPFTVADAALPVITEVKTGDRDGDGTVDKIRIVFSERVNIVDGGNENDFKININYGGSPVAIRDGSYSGTYDFIEYEIEGAQPNDPSLYFRVEYDDFGVGSVKDSDGNEMSDSFAINGDAPKRLSGVTMSALSYVINQATTYTLNFTTNEELDTGAKIKVAFPQGVVVPPTASGSCPSFPGGIQAGVDDQVVTLQRTVSALKVKKGSYSCTITGVRNPVVAGKTGFVIVETTDNDDLLLEYENSAASFTYVTEGVPPQTVNPNAPSNPSIIINGGSTSTASQNVTLQLNAGNTPAEMLISNYASFLGGDWEPFAVTKNWILSPETGLKTVYVKFRNSSGESIGASDSIILGTETAGSETPAGGTYTDPTDRTRLLAERGKTADVSCEDTYRPLVDADLNEFTILVSESIRNAAVYYICYGISSETDALGAGERRAVLRDYFDTTAFSGIYWDDIARTARGEKLVHRNLQQETAQLPEVLTTFQRIFGHRPVFSNQTEDIAWNTLQYRIRFPRDLTKERAGITAFRSMFGKDPATPFEWATVRVLGYVR